MRLDAGFSVLEIVVVLAIFAAVIATTLSLRPVTVVARDAAALAQQLRIVRLRQVLGGSGGALDCVENVIDSRSSIVVAWPPRGLAFDAEAMPRTCDGGGAGNTTIVLEHRGEQAAVIVSALGRVRWERR